MEHLPITRNRRLLLRKTLRSPKTLQIRSLLHHLPHQRNHRRRLPQKRLLLRLRLHPRRPPHRRLRLRRRLPPRLKVEGQRQHHVLAP
ncbi:hypothetical protein COL5a_005491 [Colletotrichum fioriniae]|nr:hypothetical protein COL5a_005491 [Colletotrichum fioriniae]